LKRIQVNSASEISLNPSSPAARGKPEAYSLLRRVKPCHLYPSSHPPQWPVRPPSSPGGSRLRAFIGEAMFDVGPTSPGASSRDQWIPSLCHAATWDRWRLSVCFRTALFFGTRRRVVCPPWLRRSNCSRVRIWGLVVKPCVCSCARRWSAAPYSVSPEKYWIVVPREGVFSCLAT
jgi:hypothetical protein